MTLDLGKEASNYIRRNSLAREILGLLKPEEIKESLASWREVGGEPKFGTILWEEEEGVHPWNEGTEKAVYSGEKAEKADIMARKLQELKVLGYVGGGSDLSMYALRNEIIFGRGDVALHPDPEARKELQELVG